ERRLRRAVVVGDRADARTVRQRRAARRGQRKSDRLIAFDGGVARYRDVDDLRRLAGGEGQGAGGGGVVAAGGRRAVAGRIGHRDRRGRRGRQRDGEGEVAGAAVAFGDRGVGDRQRRQDRRRVTAEVCAVDLEPGRRGAAAAGRCLKAERGLVATRDAAVPGDIAHHVVVSDVADD